MKRIHRAWLVCIGCGLLLLCTIGLISNCFAVFQPYLIRDRGLTNAQASAVSTVRSLFSLLAMLLVGWYYRHLSLRFGAAAALAAGGVSCLLFSAARGFAACCAAAAVAGLSYGLGGMVPAALLMERWFRRRGGLAIGICTAGSGVATIFAPPLLTAAVRNISLSAAFALEGGVVFLLLGAVLLLIRSRPEEMGLQPLGADLPPERRSAAAPAENAPPLAGWEQTAMLTVCLLLGMVCSAGFIHLPVLYESEHFSDTTVSWLLSLFGVTLTVGKCVCGQITDSLGSAGTGWLFFGVLGVGLLLSCGAGNGSIAAASAAFLLLGMGMSLSSVGVVAWARDLSSPAQYAGTMQAFQLAYLLGGLGFNTVPGILADATGSYLPAYRLLTLFTAVGLLLLEWVYHRRAAAPPQPHGV